MPRTRFGHDALVFSIVCLGALSSGFTRPQLQRVGPDHGGSAAIKVEDVDAKLTCNAARGGRLKLDGDVRSTLPRCASQVFAVQLVDGCRMDFGVANLSTAPQQFHVAFKRGERGFVDEPSFEVAPAQAWTDASMTVRTDQPLREVRFSVTGADAEHGVFTRPLVTCPNGAAAKEPLRNVILVSLDTMRADYLGAYGKPHSVTPTIDRIAQEGTTFLNAFSQYPNTHGSHAVLFTGEYTSKTGMGGGFRSELGPKQVTLASELASRGYVTVAFTEDAYVGSAYGFDRGFDSFHDGIVTKEKLHGHSAVTFKRALDWLKRRSDQPFFMFLHTYEVHTPYAPSAAAQAAAHATRPDYHGKLEAYFDGKQTTAFNFGQLKLTADELRWVSWLYEAEAWTLDEQMGLLYATLRELNILDSTLIVLFSDHGEEFGEHGYMAHGESLHREALHVPLIFRAPGVVPDGLQIQSPVGLIDVASTIGDLLGVGPVLAGTASRSQAPRMRGEPPKRAAVWGELTKTATACGAPKGYGFGTCRFDGLVVRDKDFAFFQSAALQREWLYDRKADPLEQRDIALEKPEVVARYRRMMDEFRRTAGKRTQQNEAQVDVATESRLRALGYAK